MNRWQKGEFHRSSADTWRPNAYAGSRHLGYDRTSMGSILDHSQPVAAPPMRPPDGVAVRGALDYGSAHSPPAEPSPRGRRPIVQPASEMSSLLTHNLAPPDRNIRARDGGNMASLIAGEDAPPAAVAGSSEALNNRQLPGDAGARRRGPGAADPLSMAATREGAMQRMHNAYREVLKLLSGAAREQDGSLPGATAKAVLTTVHQDCAVHLSPAAAGALLALCDVREQPTWEEFVVCLAEPERPPEDEPAPAPAPSPMQMPSQMQQMHAQQMQQQLQQQQQQQQQQQRPLMPLQAPQLSAAQAEQNTWRQLQQQQQLSHPGEWQRPPSCGDEAPLSLDPAEMRRQVQAARNAGDSAALARLFNGGDASRHARSNQLSAAVPTWGGTGWRGRQ